jgi:hypothetical protein
MGGNLNTVSAGLPPTVRHNMRPLRGSFRPGLPRRGVPVGFAARAGPVAPRKEGSKAAGKRRGMPGERNDKTPANPRLDAEGLGGTAKAGPADEDQGFVIEDWPEWDEQQGLDRLAESAVEEGEEAGFSAADGIWEELGEGKPPDGLAAASEERNDRKSRGKRGNRGIPPEELTPMRLLPKVNCPSLPSIFV